MGDSNAHHKLWADSRDTLIQDGRGEELRSWQCVGQWMLASPEGPTWEREVEGRWRRTTIDLIFYRGVVWEQANVVKLSAIHWTVGGLMEVGDLRGVRRVRAGIDWPCLEALVADSGGRLVSRTGGRRRIREVARPPGATPQGNHDMP